MRGNLLDSVWIPLVLALALASTLPWQILVPTISLEPVDGIPPNWPGYTYYVRPPKVRGGHIDFSVDPVGVGINIGVTDSCTHDISWTSWWNSTKFVWIYHWNKLKSWLGFGDLDLIFKVTGGFRWQITIPTISLEPFDRIPPNLPGYIIGTRLKADQVLVTLTTFSRSQQDLDIWHFHRKWDS